MLTGPDSVKYCRKPEIMGDAAYAILTSDPSTTTGNFFTDEQILKQAGIANFDQFACDPNHKHELIPDGFLDEAQEHAERGDRPSFRSRKKYGRIDAIFKAIETNLCQQSVKETRAVFQFIITGAGKWFIDLKTGKGSCGCGESPTTPDITLIAHSEDFLEIFAGKIKPASAFMMKKLKISGDVRKVLKLDRLISSLNSNL